MKTLDIQAKVRPETGKKAIKALRREGRIPCNLYGGGENVSFSVDAKEIKSVVYTPNSYIVEFVFEDGKKEKAVMREIQFHPVEDQILHIDFYRVTPGKPVAIDIPVELVGTSEGVKQGGKLMLSKRSIRISATEENLPDTIRVDITNLNLGSSIFVGDLDSSKYTILTPATTAICAVRMTRAARGAAAKTE